MILDWVTFGEPLTFWQMLLRIVAAVIFGAIIGVEREAKNRPAACGPMCWYAWAPR